MEHDKAYVNSWKKARSIIYTMITIAAVNYWISQCSGDSKSTHDTNYRPFPTQTDSSKTDSLDTVIAKESSSRIR
jgi:hypothetical protein